MPEGIAPTRRRPTAEVQLNCPRRLYTPADVPAMQADLEGAKALFHADGDGLPAPEIDALTKVPFQNAQRICRVARLSRPVSVQVSKVGLCEGAQLLPWSAICLPAPEFDALTKVPHPQLDR
jgi:hypothetical protein